MKPHILGILILFAVGFILTTHSLIQEKQEFENNISTLSIGMDRSEVEKILNVPGEAITMKRRESGVFVRISYTTTLSFSYLIDYVDSKVVSVEKGWL